MIKIGIDQSGTGTTYIVCYIKNKLVDKTEIISKEWTIHVLKILKYIKEQQECNIYIEDCLPIQLPSTKDRDSLLKLIGALKFNTYNYLLDENFNKKTKSITPIFTKSVVKNIENLSKYNNGYIQKFSKNENLTYEYGKGWKYNN